MSAAAPAVAAAPALPPLSRQLGELLHLVGGRQAGGWLVIDGRSVGGLEQRHLDLECSPKPGSWLPEALLTSLEDDVWSLFVGAAVRRGRRSLDPVRLCVLPATWTLRPMGRKVQPDPERRAAARAALAAFPLEPSALIWGGSPEGGAGFSLTAIFAFAEPLDCRDPKGEAAGMATIRRLSAALGADVPGESVRLHELSLPLPGFRVREGNEQSYARVLELESSRTYDTEAIEAAIGGRKRRS